MTQSIVVRQHELSQQPVVLEVRAGQTILGMLNEVMARHGQPGAEIAEGVTVTIEGREVPRRLWAHVRPRTGKRVHATCFSLEGSSAKQIIGAIILIVVAWWAAAGYAALSAGGTVFGLSGAAGYAAVGGVYMLSTLAVQALTKPPTPGAPQGTEGQWRALTGTSNQINPWGVIPFVIGEHRFFPPHAALPYTETIGERSYQYCLFDLGHGDIEVSDIRIGDTPIGSFEGVRYNITRTPTIYVNDVSEASVGSTIEHGDTTPVLRTTAPDVTSISLDLIYPQGHFGVGTSGKTFSMWTAWRIRYRQVGTTTWLTPTNPRRSGITPNKPAAAPVSATANYWVQSARKKPFGTSLAWDVPAGQYEVQVTRIDSLRGGSANTYVDMAAWTVLRSIKRGASSKTGTNKLEMLILATDQINGTLQNLSCLVKQKIKVYDRDTDTWSAPQTNLNPAWVVWWLMTECPGVAKHVPLSRMHLDGFADYAEFCEANSFEARGVCDSAQVLGDLVNDVLQCSIGSLGMRDGRYTVVYDPGVIEPTMEFTPRETKNFQMARKFVTLPHALRVQFVNPDAEWQQDEIIVLDDGYSYRGVDARGNPSSDPEPERYETLQLRYAADAIHAWRVGRFHFAQGKFRLSSYSWESDIAGLGTVRGDCVLVPNDVLEWGDGWGTVVAIESGGISAATVTLDNSWPTDPGKSYRLQFRKADGTAATANVAAAGGDTNVFALTSLPAGVQPGDTATLVEVTRELVPLLVTGVQYQGIDSTSFTAVAYDPRVGPYWADPPAFIASEITGRQYGIPDAPIVDGVVSSPDHDEVDDAGIVGPVIRIGVRRPNRVDEHRMIQ